MRVGFVGLGQLGAAIARFIVDAGFDTVLYDAQPRALEPFAGTGAVLASGLAEVAVASDLVGVCVVDDAQLREVVAGPGGLLEAPMPSGSTIAVHSTVHPATCVELARRARDAGVGLVDAPMSYGGQGADMTHARVVVVGADDETTFDRCRPVFESFATSLCHAGPVGTGETVKLMNSLLNVVNMGSAAAAIHLGEAVGAPRAPLVRTLLHGSASSQGLRTLQSVSGLIPSADDRRHVWAILRKDVDLALDVARRNGVEVSGLASAAEAGLGALAEAVDAPLIADS
jgi:3-hydroxyisobutyrate dehydrogenase-like beta-hydroxyacid dehydrogenase